MRMARRRDHAAKVATNLSLRRDLVRRAKTLGLNLSKVVEASLERVVRETERAAWDAENRQAIDAYNARVAEHGVFGDGWRKF